MLQKVEGNLLAGKKKKKDLRMEEDPDKKLPGIRKDNDCGMENTLLTKRTPTRVSKDQNRKQTLGLSPLSRKIGNNQMKQNLKTGKVGKLKLLFEGPSPLLREKQVRPNLSKYNPFAVHDKLNPRVRPGYDRRDMMGNRTPVWQELDSRLEPTQGRRQAGPATTWTDSQSGSSN